MRWRIVIPVAAVVVIGAALVVDSRRRYVAADRIGKAARRNRERFSPVVVFGQQFAWAPRRQWLAISEEKRIRVPDAITGRTVVTIPVRALYGFATWSLGWEPSGRSLTVSVRPATGDRRE